jgi:hypothetical protein
MSEEKVDFRSSKHKHTCRSKCAQYICEAVSQRNREGGVDCKYGGEIKTEFLPQKERKSPGLEGKISFWLCQYRQGDLEPGL